MPFLIPFFLKRHPPQSRERWLPIISTLLALLTLLTIGGCSTTRLAYNNAPTLTFWWLDGYFDFDSEQSVRMRNELQSLQTWHRKEELPLVAAELAHLKTRALQDATPEQTCKLAADLQARALAPLERLLPGMAGVAPGLTDAQMQYLERAFEKRSRTWREDYLDGTASERADARLKQTTARVESLYGRLRPEQVAWLRAKIMTSSYDAATQYAESQRRHQDALQVLRQIRNTKPGTHAAQAVQTVQAAHTALIGLLERSVTSPNPSYRQYQATILQQGCSTMAELHNGMSPAQRKKLQDALQGYEDDMRALVAWRKTD